MGNSQWESFPINELCIFAIDCVNKTAPIVDYETPYKMIRTTNVKDGFIDTESVRYVTEETFKKWTRRSKPQYGDVILTREAPVGSVGRFTTDDKNIFLGQRLFHYRPDPEKLDWNYLSYVLQSEALQGWLNGIAFGATVPHITVADAETIKIPTPPIDIQKKIGKILSNYDDLIENNLKQIKLLEEKARLTYEEWFLRFRINGIKLDIDEKTGLPSGWIKQELSSIVKFEGGFAFKSETYEENQKFKIVTIKNVQDGIFIPNTTDTLSSIPDKVKKYQVLKNGDIIMSLTGNVGRVCLVYGENYLLNQRVVKITPIKKNDYSYVYSMFRHSSMLTMLENISNGAAQQNLSPVSTGKLKVVVPTDEIRKQYEKIVNPIINNIINYNLQNQLLKESRDILLPRLMTGLIDVENINIEV
ncbi:restriction endonuclease subunit S [Aliarcobacter butzleri]|uniref:restriction endonuclease subunit S n=1 Tax=Aliarcobacter butzleri TaxID=28197 RepID=UPI001EDABD31|nr:restriction endonuclease subunit S [Aliarcobacter butzleri]MCG3676233.1 restriction endonuclease subunit S [Aliarcobacter butzleri]